MKGCLTVSIPTIMYVCMYVRMYIGTYIWQEVLGYSNIHILNNRLAMYAITAKVKNYNIKSIN